MSTKVGFIGGGNICKAIIGGLLKAGYTSGGNITVSDRAEAALAALKKETGVNISNDNRKVAAESDFLILSVKPNIYDSVISEINGHVGKETIVISVAAGITLEKIQKGFTAPQKIVRTMPNTPAMVGEGMTAICPNQQVTPEETQQVLDLFGCCGRAELLPEPLFHVESAVAGSSPAYAYMFIEAMADAAVASGLPRDKAYTFCAQAVLGAAKMVLDTGLHPGLLKDMVCSPGGTTIEGVLALENHGFRGAVTSAIEACTEKSMKMEKGHQ